MVKASPPFLGSVQTWLAGLMGRVKGEHASRNQNLKNPTWIIFIFLANLLLQIIFYFHRSCLMKYFILVYIRKENTPSLYPNGSQFLKASSVRRQTHQKIFCLRINKALSIKDIFSVLVVLNSGTNPKVEVCDYCIFFFELFTFNVQMFSHFYD